MLGCFGMILRYIEHMQALKSPMVMLQGWLKMDEKGSNMFKHPLATSCDIMLQRQICSIPFAYSNDASVSWSSSSPAGKYWEIAHVAHPALLSFCGGTGCF